MFPSVRLNIEEKGTCIVLIDLKHLQSLFYKKCGNIPRSNFCGCQLLLWFLNPLVWIFQKSIHFIKLTFLLLFLILCIGLSTLYALDWCFKKIYFNHGFKSEEWMEIEEWDEILYQKFWNRFDNEDEIQKVCDFGQFLGRCVNTASKSWAEVLENSRRTSGDPSDHGNNWWKSTKNISICHFLEFFLFYSGWKVSNKISFLKSKVDIHNNWTNLIDDGFIHNSSISLFFFWPFITYSKMNTR
jgi:hypothetical protein